MIIFGRSPNLMLAFLSAVFNGVVLFHINGFAPTPEQIGGVNAILFALVALIANTDSITKAAAEAAEKRNGKA